MKRRQRRQLGMVLPTVLALAMLSSVLVMAEWRNLSLAEGWGQVTQQRWTLQQTSHAALLAAVQDIQGPLTDDRHLPGKAGSTHAFFPRNTSAWKTLQARLGAQDCLSGICQPLGDDDNSYNAWKDRIANGQRYGEDAGLTVLYWVEVLPLISRLGTLSSPFVYRITVWAQNSSNAIVVSQALWHPTPSHPASTAIPMNLSGFKRLMQLSP
jgi:Tfp pilus assembly protein PilX